MALTPKLRLTESVITRFWSYVRKEAYCWEWLGCRAKNGYGQLRCKSIFKCYTHYAHRISYIIHYGDIPEDINILHKCNNKGCVNPEHLYKGTQLENIQQASNDGLLPSGQDHYLFETSPEIREKIFALRQEGYIQEDIAKLTGFNQSHISRVLSGKDLSKNRNFSVASKTRACHASNVEGTTDDGNAVNLSVNNSRNTII